MSYRTAQLEPAIAGSLDQLDPTNLALAGFLSRYKGNTLRCYREHLSIYLGWCATVRLEPLQATRPHLELYLRWLEQQGWSPSTVSGRFGTVTTFYRYATLDEIIARDPSTYATRPKVDIDSQRRTFLQPLEFAAFLAAARLGGPMDHALVALLAMCGLRVGEACGLDVDSLREERGGHVVLRFIGKGGKPALVPLPIPVIRAVRAAVGDRTEGPLLLNTQGRRMDRSSATRVIRRLAKRAHVTTDISPHSLRRTFCTSGLVSGVPIYEMQLSMRHSNTATTARYDMAAKNLDRNANHRVAAYLAGMAD